MSLISKYGTVAEYRVGFVKFIFACRVNVDFVVSKISREPTLGEKLPNPLEIAAETVSFHYRHAADQQVTNASRQLSPWPGCL